MNAIRRDEELDNLHSIYVDQWDWERVITADQRTLDFLRETVRDIVDAVCATSDELRWKFPELKNIHLDRDVAFITTQELEDLYPELTAKQRENAFAKEHGTVCIMQIGGKLRSGKPHDGRAPDYDDWALNCDILFWHVPWAVRWSFPAWVSVSMRNLCAASWKKPAARSVRNCPSTRCCWTAPYPDYGRRHRPEPPVHAAVG